jgi:uncharacterized protein (DUF305 family)
MRTRNRTAAVAGLLAGVLVLAACGDGDDPTVGGSATDTSTTAESADFNDQDKQWAADMAVHHSGAIEMSDLILAKDPPEPVRALAERIKAAQDPEIEQLHEMLEAFGVEVSGDGHGGHEASGEMAGMTEDDMAQLEAASGPDAVRLYLEGMIAHHRGAIEMSETQIAEGRYAPAIELARKIRDDQTAEIAEIEQLLTQL